jgi:hypothetical protein
MKGDVEMSMVRIRTFLLSKVRFLGPPKIEQLGLITRNLESVWGGVPRGYMARLCYVMLCYVRLCYVRLGKVRLG